MATEWINLYDSETGECQSSWIRSIGWNDGIIILRRYDEDPQSPTTVRYDEDKEIFNQLRNVHESGGSVGSAVNEMLIEDKDVDPAEGMN